MKFWEKFSTFKQANKACDEKQSILEKKNPLKKIFFQQTQNTKPSFFLRFKSIFYLLKQDKKNKLLKYFLKNPVFYFFNLLKSYFNKNPYIKKNGAYLHNLRNFNDLKNMACNKNVLFIFGFSYCSRPFECLQKRFSSKCFYNYKNDICRQCFTGRCANAIQNNDIFLMITDVYYLGEQIVDIIQKNPKKEIVFIISCCKFSIELFSDFANMLQIKGLSLPLKGQTCININSFLYAEKGKKSTLTYINDENKKIFLEILNLRYKSQKNNLD